MLWSGLFRCFGKIIIIISSERGAYVGLEEDNHQILHRRGWAAEPLFFATGPSTSKARRWFPHQ